MAYKWRILKSAVEQEILFPSEEVYENYIAGFIRRKEPFEIVDEQKNEDGTYTVVMRKCYNNNPFFRKEEEIPDEVLRKILQEGMKLDAEAIMREVEADPNLKNVEAPQEMHDGIMEQIRTFEGCSGDEKEME